MTTRGFIAMIQEVHACRLCEPDLPLGPRPILQIDPQASVLIAGQAPGRLTLAKGRPFDDPSGERLRNWLGVDRAAFYDPSLFAILPMGMCYPGTGVGGDLPPRPECAAHWRERLLAALPRIQLTLVIGQYALDWHLGRGASVDKHVLQWRDGLARGVLPLPHPSPRNQRWIAARPWFATDVLPALRERVAALARR